MIESLWCYMSGVRAPSPQLLETVFAYNVRFQILTDTQEQKDYLTSMQLMFGREVDIRTWEEWNRRPYTIPVECDPNKIMLYPEDVCPRTLCKREPLLPIYFSTSVQRHDR